MRAFRVVSGAVSRSCAIVARSRGINVAIVKGDSVVIESGPYAGKIGKVESFGKSWNGETAQVYIGGLFSKTVLVRDLSPAQARQ